MLCPVESPWAECPVDGMWVECSVDGTWAASLWTGCEQVDRAAKSPKMTGLTEEHGNGANPVPGQHRVAGRPSRQARHRRARRDLSPAECGAGCPRRLR